ncbi:MAG: hypothetical protein ABSH32_11005 [Bryobacteraceae bacterium]|jgi:hypothetical protein
MRTPFRLASSFLAIALTAASAPAGEIPIDISGLVDVPWTYLPPPCQGGINNGTTFPTGSQNFGGVPLSIPAGPNNYWNGGVAANCESGTVRVTIPVGVSGVTSAFTLLNSMWGQPGPQAYLFVTFRGSDGATVTAPLVGGVNVRDFNNDGFQNTINNTTTTQVWANGLGQRLDRQEYILPAAFASQVLTSVTITDTGNESFSRAILSALTVSTCHAYVAAGVTISSSAIVYYPRTMLYTQDVSLTNTSQTAAVDGPLYLILEDLPAGVSIANESRPTSCYAPIGSPYLVAIPEGSSLAPNTSVIVRLQFRDPSGVAISYTPLAVVSGGATP